MTWSSVSGSENEYYVFVAKFDDDINDEQFSLGDQYNVDGQLDTRGNQGKLNTHWTIVHSRIGTN